MVLYGAANGICSCERINVFYFFNYRYYQLPWNILNTLTLTMLKQTWHKDYGETIFWGNTIDHLLSNGNLKCMLLPINETNPYSVNFHIVLKTKTNWTEKLKKCFSIETDKIKLTVKHYNQDWNPCGVTWSFDGTTSRVL